MQKINCRDCRHYHITFDASAPYGCRAYGFKSKVTPSVAVYQSSGMQCTLFLAKKSESSNGSNNKKSSGGGFYA